MDYLRIALIVVGSLVGLYIFLSIVLGIAIIQFSIRPLIQNPKKSHKNSVRKGFTKGLDSMERKEMLITLSDGYQIHADVSVQDSKKFMIICHGHCANREAVLKYTRVFYSLGYSVFLFDQRGHGYNKRHKCYMGLQEHKDLVELIHKVKELYGNDIELGVFGVSMGGASTLMMLKEVQDLSFCVIDCAFADVETVFNDMCDRKYLIGHFLANPIGRAWLKVIHHLSFKQIDAKQGVVNNHVPMLFIHGIKDDLIYFHNQDIIINNLPKDCYFERYSFENAKHDDSVVKDYDRYLNIVTNFISNVNSLKKEDVVNE